MDIHDTRPAAGESKEIAMTAKSALKHDVGAAIQCPRYCFRRNRVSVIGNNRSPTIGVQQSESDQGMQMIQKTIFFGPHMVPGASAIDLDGPREQRCTGVIESVVVVYPCARENLT